MLKSHQTGNLCVNLEEDLHMHSFDGERHTYHFNSDFSGDICIIEEESGHEMRVPAEDLLKLVAYKYVLPQKIGKLEDMEYKDLLK
jgi:hypothetical protein